MFIHDTVLTKLTYRGIPIVQLPLDLWVYQELMHRLKTVRCVLEIGTYRGGSALALYDMMCAVNQCVNNRVVTIGLAAGVSSDLVLCNENIVCVIGDATTEDVAALVYEKCSPYRDSHIMVIDDGSHMCHEVLKALQLYHPLVRVGGYYVVEDTICHHGLEVGPSPGPYEAVQKFLCVNHSFVVDTDCEKFGLTYNPSGFLRRVK